MAIVFDYESIAKGVQNWWVPKSPIQSKESRPVAAAKLNRCDQNYHGTTCPLSGVCVKRYVSNGRVDKCENFGGQPVGG